MVLITEEMIKDFQAQLEKIDETLKKTFMNIHNGYQRENLVSFLKAREGNVSDAYKMWRIQNDIDDVVTKPINPTDLYRAIRDSQLVGVCGYTKQGLPVIAVGVGLSTYDKASVDYYLQSHIQMNEYRDRVILVVRPLLEERTRNKVQLLRGSGKDELLKIMNYESLPHLCRKERSVSSTVSCYSLDHPFHQQMYKYMMKQGA